jgi:hypothetical protein
MFCFVVQTFSRTYIVDQNHASASDQNDATEVAPLKTIQAAAEKAQAGDTVYVKAGIYRERVTPPRGGSSGSPIVYKAEPGRKVFIKGSDVWKPQWAKVEGQDNVYKATPDQSMFTDNSQIDGANPYRISTSANPKKIENPNKIHTLGQVFVNGQKLQQLAIVDKVYATPGTWTCQYKVTKSDEIIVHFPEGTSPDNAEVELTVRRRVFAPHKRGLAYITVVGFVMEHVANQFPGGFYTSNGNPQAGLIGTRSGNHWVFDNNVIRHAASIGLDIGDEGDKDIEGVNDRQGEPRGIGSHTIINNIFIYNGCAGVMGLGAPNTLFKNNFFAHNNDLYFESAEQGGIKVHLFTNSRIEDNFFYRNHCKGLWLDNRYNNTRVTRNVFIENDKAGFMYELASSDKALFDNNILYRNKANNIYSHDASGMTIAHNIVANSHGMTLHGNYGEGYFGRNVTTRGTAYNKHNRLYNNIFVDNGGGDLKLAYPATRSGDNISDFNIFNGTDDRDLFRIHYHCGAGTTPWGSGDSREQNFWEIVCKDIGNECTDFEDVKETGKGSSKEDFAEWKAFWKTKGTNNDQNSIVTNGFMVTYNPETFEMHINVPFDLSTFKTKAMSNVDKDFLGNTVPEGTALAGPIQNLKQGGNTIKVWDASKPYDPDVSVAIRARQTGSILPMKKVETRMLTRFSRKSDLRIDAKRVDVYAANGRRLYSIQTQGNSGISLVQQKVEAQGVMILKIIR